MTILKWAIARFIIVTRNNSTGFLLIGTATLQAHNFPEKDALRMKIMQIERPVRKLSIGTCFVKIRVMGAKLTPHEKYNQNNKLTEREHGI